MARLTSRRIRQLVLNVLKFGLRWSDVDLANGVVTIPLSKSGRARHVFLNRTAVAILQALPSRLKSPYVFASSKGTTPLHPKNFLNRHFLPAIETAGIADFRWHDLRHTFASRLTMAGGDLRTVQELMGHQTVTMTMRYAHLAPSHLREAVQRICRVHGDTLSDTPPESSDEATANLA